MGLNQNGIEIALLLIGPIARQREGRARPQFVLALFSIVITLRGKFF
jgi:hypothetical protein